MKTVASERALATHTTPSWVVSHNVHIGCVVCGMILRFNRRRFVIECPQCHHVNSLNIKVYKDL